MAEKFVRFVVCEPDPVTGVYIGFFKTAYAMRLEAYASVHDADQLNALLNWLDDNLDVATRFAKSKNRHAHGKALSWVKPSASDHIQKSQELMTLLESYSVRSEMLTTATPGVIVYEDEWQVAAIPFKERDF